MGKNSAAKIFLHYNVIQMWPTAVVVAILGYLATLKIAHRRMTILV